MAGAGNFLPGSKNKTGVAKQSVDNYKTLQQCMGVEKRIL